MYDIMQKINSVKKKNNIQKNDLFEKDKKILMLKQQLDIQSS